jgi:hypothetical protein
VTPVLVHPFKLTRGRQADMSSQAMVVESSNRFGHAIFYRGHIVGSNTLSVCKEARV